MDELCLVLLLCCTPVSTHLLTGNHALVWSGDPHVCTLLDTLCGDRDGVSMGKLDRAYNNEKVIVKLPEGVTWNDTPAISVW